jgi:alpha-tubulin suppressor-like RCC1 family protein
VGEFGKIGAGTGDTGDKSSPASVVGGITNWSQLSAGTNHSLGVTSSGILYAWGYNAQGQLGDGTVINRSSPVTVTGGLTGWLEISAGGKHSLGVLLVETGIE